MSFCSRAYWEKRYKGGGTSGRGSTGHLLDFKAMVINHFIRTRGIGSVIDLGCGDGSLAKAICCDVYMGYDVSKTAISRCMTDSALGDGKHFYEMVAWCGESADLAMSIDVVFHLVEDEVFHKYMSVLFSAADHHVIVYSSNHTNNAGMSTHVKHRKFTDWVEENAPEWELQGFTKNHFPFDDGDPQGSFCDFYFFKRRDKK